MRTTLLLLILLGTATIATWQALRNVPVEESFYTEALFSQVPENDESFRSWLQAQRDVRKPLIDREQVKDGWLIKIRFLLRRQNFEDQQLPDLDLTSVRSGYVGKQSLMENLQMTAQSTPPTTE